jgi:hypothetical protein
MNDAAVVVITCKKFEQAWDPFFILFKKFWADCPYKVYMVTDVGHYDDELVNNITVGQDLGFAGNLLHALNKIPNRYVLYFQEDYFFSSRFDTERINGYVQHVKEHDIMCLRLAPCPGPTKPWEHDESLGVLEKGASYRISTQTAIWDKEFLKTLVIPGETGGQFEIRGTSRISRSPKRLLSVWRSQSPTPYYITGIVRNVWQDGALQLLRRNDILTDHIRKVIK